MPLLSSTALWIRGSMTSDDAVTGSARLYFVGKGNEPVTENQAYRSGFTPLYPLQTAAQAITNPINWNYPVDFGVNTPPGVGPVVLLQLSTNITSPSTELRIYDLFILETYSDGSTITYKPTLSRAVEGPAANLGYAYDADLSTYMSLSVTAADAPFVELYGFQVVANTLGAPDSGTANMRFSFTQDPAELDNNLTVAFDDHATIDAHGSMSGSGSNNFSIGTSATQAVHTWSSNLIAPSVADVESMGVWASLGAGAANYVNAAVKALIYDIWIDLHWTAQGITRRYRPTAFAVTTANPFDTAAENQAALPSANYSNLAAAYDADQTTFATLSLTALITQLPYLSGSPVAGSRVNYLGFTLSETITNASSNPQLMLRCSNDGGKTFGVERLAAMGKAGNFVTLARWRQLGRSNNRVFEVSCSEAVQVALIEASLDSHG